jgi:tetratricopeptide (TPR) repeat protein
VKNLPKIEKKHLIAGGALTAVAVVAFVLGTHKTGTPEDSTPKSGATHAAAPSQSATPERAPAAAPAKDDAGDSENYEEEEDVDTEIAHTLPHGKKMTETKDTVVASESAPAPVVDHRGLFTRVVDTYADAWASVNLKVHSIQQAEEENKKLKLENAYLRVMVETGRFNVRAEEAKKKTETVGKKLATAAGSRAARSIASISYQFPENLLPEQLLALGVSYFKVKDDEKAAVILNFLTELDDDKSFRTASNYLMAGIAFYRLDHYKNAAEYFDRIAKLSETDEVTVKSKRQALYWQALVAERAKNRGLAQKLLLDSLEKDPLTKEARWVNPQGISTKTRMPASVTEEKETEESHEGPVSNHD